MSVPLVGPDGQQYVLDNDDPAALDNLRAQGFKTPDEAGDFLDPARAGIQGAVRGLTGGLSDALLDDKRGGALESSTEQAKRLQAENPLASGLGELGGMLVSPLNKAGELVTRGIGATTKLGRIGANVAGGMSTGALFGAGKTMSDAALGDIDLTAETLLAGAGLGALLGGAGGGVAGAIEEGARAVLPRLSTLAKRAQSTLDDIANDAAIASTRAQQSIINKIGDEKLKQVAKVLRERGHLELTPQKMAESLAKDREALGKTLGQFLDDAQAAGSRPDLMKVIGRLDDFEARLNPMEREMISGDVSKARRAVAELGAGGNDSFRALDELKRTIQSKAKFSRGPVPLDDVTFGLRRQLAGHFRDELDQQLLPALGSEAAKRLTESKAIYGALKDAERLAESGVSRVGERGALTYVGLKDLLAGVAGASIHPMGAAAALGSKLMREHGAAIAARIADRLAKEPALTQIAKSFAAALPAAVPKLGPYGPVLAEAAAISPAHALATHMAYAQVEPSYAATAQMAGLSPEQPDEHAAALGRAQSMAEAAAAVKAQDDAIRKGVDRVFRGGGSSVQRALKTQDFGAMRMRRGPGDGYLKRVEEVRNLATDPEALLERVTGNLGPVAQLAPAVAGSMAATASRAVAYLAKQAEVPPKAGPLAPEWDAPEADRFSFAQKLEVIQNPMSVLEAAAAGELTEEQVEALQSVYPRLARQIADAALEKMVDAPESVPYASRLMLNMLTGVDPDGSFGPEAIARNQAAIAASGSKRRDDGVPGAREPRGDMTVAQRTATPQQRREVRDEA